MITVAEFRGYQKLWAAVLAGAVADICMDRKTGNPTEYRAMQIRKADAERWVRSTAMFIGSFQWICDALDLRPNVLRSQIAVWVKRPHRQRKDALAKVGTECVELEQLEIHALGELAHRSPDDPIDRRAFPYLDPDELPEAA